MAAKINKKVVEEVAKIIHGYVQISTLSTYYAMKKVYFIDQDDEVELDQEKYLKTVENLNKIIGTAETPYEELQPKQKELMEVLARDLIKLIKLESK